MAVLNVWTNQTTDDIFTMTVPVANTPQIDLAGTLDGANVITQYRHANADLNAWITCADGQWLAAADPAPVLPDGSIIYLTNRIFRFVLNNSGAGTDISLSITY